MQAGFYQQLIQVFAIVAAQDPDKLGKEAEDYLNRFLQPLVGKYKLFLIAQDFQIALKKHNRDLNLKKLSANSVKLMRLSQEISAELSLQERHVLIIRLYEFISGLKTDIKQALAFLDLIPEMLGVSEENHQKISDFCLNETRDKFACFVLNQSEIYYYLPDIKLLENQTGFVEKQVQPFLRHRIIRFKSGECFDFLKLRKIYSSQQSQFKFSAKQLSVELALNTNLFHKMDICFEAPAMVAVLGPSGAGKSSFLRLIAGVQPGGSGEFFTDVEHLHISMVPQEDHISADIPLLEQLRSIQSQYGLSADDSNHPEEILRDLHLEKYADTKPLETNQSRLSGGERKRFGIACSLMTNPDILLCDEPSSGLSAQDSEVLVQHLRKIADKGRLIIASLHQPEMQLLRYFEKMLYLDEGGTPVFFGSPADFFTFISAKTGRLKAGTGLLVDERTEISAAEAMIRRKKNPGIPDSTRMYPPEFWLNAFGAKNTNAFDNHLQRKHLKLNIPMTFMQDLKSLFHRKFYAVFCLIYAPMMALALALVSRFSTGDGYSPDANIHLPVFFMMSIVVAIFSGLVFSISEISREQAVRKREFVVEGDNRRFFLVKLLRLILLSGIQSILFSAIALWILDMFWLFSSLSLMYFMLMMSAATSGMLISVLAKGRSWAYIMIPIIIIPQLLFSGALIPWSKFPGVSYHDKAPIISRVMPSALAFEALMTEAIMQHPMTNFSQEQRHYLSLMYLHNILPDVENNIKFADEKTKTEREMALLNSLPQEIREYMNDSLNIDLLKSVFAANLQKDSEFSRHRALPLVWQFLQNFNVPATIKYQDKSLTVNHYAFYQNGTWRSDKSAYLTCFGFQIRHLWFSAILCLLLSIIMWGLLKITQKRWPYYTN
ncbi:MAG: ATP-binding cassette domain-containing protein [Bacteroidales bacterium]|jgi:ABC-type multidrug transport system ATPase subunit|nr:ATP-binding cassette domain-containing protein [Bacteroidales bacterium]